MLRLLPSIILTAIFVPSAAWGHYPWFLRDSTAADRGGVIFVFEDGFAPGNGEYLDPFTENASYWLRTPGKNVPTPLKFAEVNKAGKRWLTFPLEANGARAIDCYCKWGVYQGKMLHYYARHVDATSIEGLSVLARAEKLRFDLVPRVKENAMEIQVHWEGKPSAGKTVLVAGPQFKAKQLTADDQGVVRFEPAKGGLYWLRSSFIEPDPAGVDDGKEYKGLRQTATMTIALPIPGATK